MKRVAVLLGMAAVAPSVAQAQIPIAPAAPAATTPPAATAPPAAAPPAAAPAPDAGGPAPAPAPPKAPPGDEYFVEQAPAGAPPPAAAEPPAPSEPPPFEPPPPGTYYEPPPPPVSRHVAPLTSLWLGARVGWFIPFGNLWARAEPVSGSNGYVLRGVPWSDYASSGPMFELDAGVRLSRAYTVFGLWERAQLASGDNDGGPDGAQDGAESDFWALGLRASSNPDRLGFLTEVAVGYRRARTFFKNDVQYQFTDAPFEARLGLGAEWRFNPLSSLSALLTVGVGGFGSADKVGRNGNALPLTRNVDDGDGHAWATFTVGGHFDLIRSQK
jgi:hypothetical protein